MKQQNFKTIFKRGIVLVLSVVLCFALCACGDKGGSSELTIGDGDEYTGLGEMTVGDATGNGDSNDATDSGNSNDDRSSGSGSSGITVRLKSTKPENP